jgi:ent-copalyl diphosphate synthase
MMQQTNIEENIYGTTSVNQAGSFMVHDKQTCLLLVKIIEICVGRVGEASSMTNSIDGTWFIQLASSICDTLHHKMLLAQVTPTFIYFSCHILYQNRWVMVFFIFNKRTPGQ